MPAERTVITFEKLERSFYYSPRSQPSIAACEVCKAEVSWLTPEQAALLSGVTLRELFRRVEAETIHFNETPAGFLLICVNSVVPSAVQKQ